MRPLCLIAALLAAVALAAGGGGSSKASPPPGSPRNPLVAQPEKSAAASEAAPATAAKPGYDSLVENQGSKPRSRFTPCNLVSKAQAQAIVGLPLRDPLEAPRGPTCIYRSRDGKRLITLAVQSLDFRTLKRRIHGRQPVSVANRARSAAPSGRRCSMSSCPGAASSASPRAVRSAGSSRRPPCGGSTT